MIDYRERLLMGLLDCGYADIAILKNVGYDFTGIIDTLRDCGEDVTLESVTAAVFDIARQDLYDAVQDTRDELSEPDDAETDDDAERAEKAEILENLDVYSDIGFYFNYLDTHFYLKRLEDYRRVLDGGLEEIEKMAGFEFEEG